MIKKGIVHKKQFFSAILQRFFKKEAIDDTSPLSVHFNKYLHAKVANSTADKEQVYKIRHRVYCEELAYEKIQKSGQEQDEYDHYANYVVIFHKMTNQETSCVRVIQPNNSEQLLAIEKNCLQAINLEPFHPSNFKRHEICELSRLAITPEFRRRKTDQINGAAMGTVQVKESNQGELRYFPFIVIGLYLSAFALAKMLGAKHLYVMMEPRVARNLKQLGIEFHQIGSLVSYYGFRAPFYFNIEQINRKLNNDLTSLYRHLYQQIHN